MRPEPYAWSPHVEVVAVIGALALAYAYALRSHRSPRWRIACFAGGIALLIAALATPLHSLSYHLLTAHLLQNVVLAEWAPALLVLGVPPTLAATLGANGAVRAITRPLVALPMWLANYFVWHLPPAYDTALEHLPLLHLEHALYLVTGALLWWPVVHDVPWRVPLGARALYLFVAFVLASPLGLLLALLPNTIYDFYESAPERIWGLSPLTDQQIAGIAMASEEAVVFFAAFAICFFRFLASEERAGAPRAAA